MSDPVQLALLVVEKEREIERLRHQVWGLNSKLSALNSRHQLMASRLASAQRDLADVQHLNRALCDELTQDQKTNLVAEQAKRLEQLGEENVELRQQLEQALADGKRQAHPFRRRKYMDNPKRPGRRRGEGSFSRRQRPMAEQVSRHESEPLISCPQCGCTDLNERQAHENWQIDLPTISKDITQFSTESAWCPQCQRRVQSRHPEQLSQAAGAAEVCFGPRLVATAADLHARLGVPYAKIADFLGTMIEESITAGALCQNVVRLADLARSAYEGLIGQLRAAAVVHADETGWRIGVLNAWLWVFTNRQCTVYLIRGGEGARGHEAVVEILGQCFEGVLVSDCFSAYDKDKFDDWLKQKCLAHLLKDLKALETSAQAGIAGFVTETTGCLKDAIALGKQKTEAVPDEYGRRCVQIEARLDRIISTYSEMANADAARLVARLAKQRKHLFTFLYIDEVPPTNNHAERMIRPEVVARKTQGCNKSRSGAEAHAILGSILVTERQRGQSPVQRLTRIVAKRASPR